MQTVENPVITVKTEIKAEISKVWQRWTTPYSIMQWNFASQDWHCPWAVNDLREGGRFSYRMEATDGSFGFDFEGTYTVVKYLESISYIMDDNRKTTIIFRTIGDKTEIVETFEAEGEHSEELQRSGWQAILDNFRIYTEKMARLEMLQFEEVIKAPVSKVYEKMLAEKTYSEWTAEFNSSSRYEGTWEKGTRMLFLGEEKDGKEIGMVSRIKSNIPDKYVSIEHLGVISNGKETTSGPEVENWSGALENYTFYGIPEGTRLVVTMDTDDNYISYFKESWPRALNKLKEICEK